jgi:hypothetical protein
MQCPKCGHEQDDTDECRYCGIIFKKYRIFQERQAHQPRRDMMPSTGRTLREEAAAGIETVRRYWRQVASYLREKRFQQHPFYSKLISFFRFLIGTAYSKDVRLYKKRLCDQLARLSLLILLTILINAALLYFYSSMWNLYQMTAVGRQYEGYFLEKARIISSLLADHPVYLSFDFTLATAAVCMGAAVFCQFLHLSRYLYYPRDFWGKLLWWGGGLTALVAGYLDSMYVFYDFSMACFFALVPTLCLFSGCFDCANDLVPEMGDVIRKMSSRRAGFLKRVAFYMTHLVKYIEKWMNRSG